MSKKTWVTTPIVSFGGAGILYVVYYLAIINLDAKIIGIKLLLDTLWLLTGTFFLAGIMSLTIEKMNIKSTQELYQKELSKISLGFINLFLLKNEKSLGLQDTHFTDILMNIAGDTHYRKDYTVCIEGVDKEGFLTLIISYTIHNLLEQSQNRFFDFTFDNQREQIILSDLRIEKQDQSVIFEANSEKQLKKIKTQHGNNITYRYNYTLPVNDFLRIEYTIKQKVIGSNEKIFYFNSRRISQNLIIKIKKELELNYTPIFTDFHNLNQKEQVKNNGYHCYEFNGFLLPFQGFEVKLKEKKRKK